MNKAFLLISIFLFSALFSFSQKQIKKSELPTFDKIQLDKTNKLNISGISNADQQKIAIRDEADNPAGAGLTRSYHPSGSILSFDFTGLLNNNPGNNYFLVFTDGSKKELIRFQNNEKANTVINNNPGDKSIGYTGIAFWDSKAIVNLWKDKEGSDVKAKIFEWINKYAKREVNGTNINDNPFFKKSSIIQNIVANKTASSQSALPGIKAILGSLSGMDVTKYVQAFADFLKERIKEEITAAYLQKLKAEIEASKELQYMLPKTRTLFLTNDPYEIPNMGATYKAAFAEDLENLLPNFEKMVNALDTYKDLRSSEGFVGSMVAYHFADLSSKNYHPIEILRSLNDSYPYDGAKAPVITYSVAILNMLSQHLLDTSGKKWISRNEFKHISKEEVYIFLGLLYEKYGELFNASPKGNQTLKQVLLDLVEKSETPLAEKMYSFLLIVNTIDDRIKDFKESDKNVETILTLFINNADDLKQMIDFVLSLTNVQPINTDQYYKWKNVIEYALQAEEGVKSNDIGKVGTNVIAITNELFPSNPNWKKQLAEFIKILTDVVNAKSSEDIKGLLETYAAPVHSYRVARLYNHSASIASYPGLYAGYETNFNNNQSHAFSFGVTAPIGLAFHWGNFSGRADTGRSNSLFIGLFDIGAALSYRWGNDTLDLPQKITLGQIFSPGIAYIRGFKNSPLALKTGMQYTPQLRQIKDGANVISNQAGVVRFSLGLTVDIPVFILSRKKNE